MNSGRKRKFTLSHYHAGLEHLLGGLPSGQDRLLFICVLPVEAVHVYPCHQDLGISLRPGLEVSTC